MTTPLSKIMHTIASVFAINNSDKTEKKTSRELKLYTFMIKGEGIRKSVNIKASDKSSAEQKVHAQYPDCNADFLWELIRSAH